MILLPLPVANLLIPAHHHPQPILHIKHLPNPHDQFSVTENTDSTTDEIARFLQRYIDTMVKHAQTDTTRTIELATNKAATLAAIKNSKHKAIELKTQQTDKPVIHLDKGLQKSSITRTNHISAHPTHTNIAKFFNYHLNNTVTRNTITHQSTTYPRLVVVNVITLTNLSPSKHQ